MIKSYHSIPGPKSLPLIGTLWAYLPFIGKYNFLYLYRVDFIIILLQYKFFFLVNF